MNKMTIFNAFRSHIEARIQSAQNALNEATESVYSETKGSAGDKHETGRAMAQLEVENAGKILHEAQQMAGIIGLLEPGKARNSCAVGALVKTTQGRFYLSSGIGKIEIDGIDIFCIGMNSPLGQALIGKGIGEKYIVSGREFEILEIE